jgi:hypothetical protein
MPLILNTEDTSEDTTPDEFIGISEIDDFLEE